MATLQFLNPVADIERPKIPAAPRLASLEGKTIALYWNLKAGGEIALAAAADQLAKRYPGIKFRNYSGYVAGAGKLGNPEEARKITSECDAAIGTSAD